MIDERQLDIFSQDLEATKEAESIHDYWVIVDAAELADRMGVKDFLKAVSESMRNPVRSQEMHDYAMSDIQTGKDVHL